jgi:hypothetical protein
VLCCTKYVSLVIKGLLENYYCTIAGLLLLDILSYVFIYIIITYTLVAYVSEVCLASGSNYPLIEQSRIPHNITIQNPAIRRLSHQRV